MGEDWGEDVGRRDGRQRQALSIRLWTASRCSGVLAGGGLGEERVESMRGGSLEVKCRHCCIYLPRVWSCVALICKRSKRCQRSQHKHTLVGETRLH